MGINLREKFRELCHDLGGSFERSRDGDVCIVKDMDSLKTLEYFFAKIIKHGLKPEKNLFAEYKGDKLSATIVLDTFYPTPMLEYYLSVTEQPFLNIDEIDYNISSSLNELAEDIYECNIDEEGITCVERDDISVYPVGGHGQKVLNEITKLKKSHIDDILKRLNEKIKLMQKALIDAKEGNVWRYKETEYVCGIPFTIHEKNGEELALGFGLGADGGRVFEDKDIPDAIMEDLRASYIAGGVYLLEDIADYCE